MERHRRCLSRSGNAGRNRPPQHHYRFDRRLIALLPRAMQLVKYLPFVSRLYQQNKTGQQQAQTPPPRGKQTMSVEEAMEVLGLKAGYKDEDVIQAHRRMMQKVHPDRGGSDYLAAQINKAKDTLLG